MNAPTPEPDHEPDELDLLSTAVDRLLARRARCDQATPAGRGEGRHLSLAITHIEDALLRVGCANSDAARPSIVL